MPPQNTRRFWKRKRTLLLALAIAAFTVFSGQNGLGTSPKNATPNHATQTAQNNLITGTVTRVADGDTLTLIDSHGLKHRIRLHGIDAPERDQAHGKQSGQWLSEQTLNQQVGVQISGTDKYQRQIGKVLKIPPGCSQPPCEYSHDVNLEAIELGHAWWYTQYANTQSPADQQLYQQAQQTAQQQQQGLWARPKPIAPWDWRRQKRKQ
ncbi:MAG: nuclease [Limnobacter sp.]|nr:nuclease [Limnobacter sp.]